MKRALIILLTVLSVSASPMFFGLMSGAGTDVIPSDRLAPWAGNVGFRGGAIGYPNGTVPNYSTIFVNLRTTSNPLYHCDANGVTDDRNAVQAALADCPNFQVVYAPTGNYRLGDRIRFTSIYAKVLRGDGPGLTVFTGGGNGDAFNFGTFPNPGDWLATTQISSGAVRGSAAVTVASAANIQLGQLMWIEEPNTGSNIFGFGVDGGTPASNFNDRLHNDTAVHNSRHLVTDITGNVVSFDPPLMDTFQNSPRCVGYNSIWGGAWFGMEDLTVDGYSAGQGISMVGMFACWLKNVELRNYDTFGIQFPYSASMTVQQCYVHDPAEFDRGRGYSLQFDAANNCLIEDNIFFYNETGILVQGGCMGNVISYNCFFRLYNGYGGADFGSAGLYANHTPYPTMNLWEGNYSTGVQSDFYYGPSSRQTFLRNALLSCDPDVTQNRIALSFDSHQWSNNAVGNILGSTGTSAPLYAALPNATFTWTNTTPVSWTYLGTNNFSYSQATILRLGYPSSGNNDSFGVGSPPSTNNLDYLDLFANTSTLLHGNWDAAHAAVTWNSGIVNHTIPNSFYLASKPAWFNHMIWPPYVAANGILTPMAMTNIPAGWRFIVGTAAP